MMAHAWVRVSTMVTSSLSHAEGLRDGTHQLAARTCEPRPLTQATQIRPAAPVGALKLGLGRQLVRRATRDGVGRFGGQAGPRPGPTPTSPRDVGSRAGALIHILPAESARLAIAPESSWAARKSTGYGCLS